jgi:hypothetical protein
MAIVSSLRFQFFTWLNCRQKKWRENRPRLVVALMPRCLPALNTLYIVHHYLIPEVRAVGYKFLVYRVVLVGLLVGKGIEEHKLRRMIAIIHHVPFSVEAGMPM